MIHMIAINRLQYSIYAGRHVVPSLEGLLIECTAERRVCGANLACLRGHQQPS